MVGDRLEMLPTMMPAIAATMAATTQVRENTRGTSMPIE